MILDTSAIVELILGHPEAARVREALTTADALGVAAPTLAEASIVLRVRLGRDPDHLLRALLDAYHVEIIPFGHRHRLEASRAFARYGKGRHPAPLNFGDCLTYAAARLAGRPLLFVGDDFAKTDLVRA